MELERGAAIRDEILAIRSDIGGPEIASLKETFSDRAAMRALDHRVVLLFAHWWWAKGPEVEPERCSSISSVEGS